MYNRFKKFDSSALAPSVQELWALDWESLNGLGSACKPRESKSDDLKYIEDESRGELTVEEQKSHNRAYFAQQRSFKNIMLKESKEYDKVLLKPFLKEWVLPKLSAQFGQDVFAPVFANGKVNILATLKKWYAEASAGNLVYLNSKKPISNEALKGICKFISYGPRGSIIPSTPKQTINTRFNSSVPILMAAWKQYRNIDYAKYDFNQEFWDYVIDPDLLEVLEFSGSTVGWSFEQLAQFRSKACATKGADLTTKIYSIGDESFDALPRLMKLMLLQTWIYQPHLYNKYGIFNIEQLDGSAIPLVDVEILPEQNTTIITEDKAPWEIK